MTNLIARIESRTSLILASQPDWPCRKGCHHCCRHLAAIPEITASEWSLLQRGIAQLNEPVQEQIRQRTAELAGQEHPYTCPMLDPATGACLIYEHRPLACRMYGFYVERDKGLYCAQIAEANFTDVVWGNAETVQEDAARALGSQRQLTVWMFSHSR